MTRRCSMKRACALRWFLWMLTAAAVSAQPVITDLQPRGVQKGRPFTLTLTGRNLGDGTKIRSSMPATFTLLAPERTGSMPDGRPDGRMDGRYATFLVEPTGDLAVGA